MRTFVVTRKERATRRRKKSGDWSKSKRRDERRNALALKRDGEGRGWSLRHDRDADHPIPARSRHDEKWIVTSGISIGLPAGDGFMLFRVLGSGRYH